MQQARTKILTYENVDFLLLAALLVSFFLHYRINGFIAMLLIIYGVIKLFVRRFPFKGSRGLVFFPALFLLLILGQLYTTDLKEGWTLVERNLSLFLLPFAAHGITTLNLKQKRVLIQVFIGSAFITGLVCLGIAGYESWQEGSVYVIPNNPHFLYNRFMHHRLTDPIGMHAVYYSLFIAFSGCVLLYQIISIDAKRKQRLVQGILLVFFCFLLYLLKSANIVFGFSIACLFILGYQFRKTIFKSKQVMLVAALILIGLSFFVYTTIQTKIENFSLSDEMDNEQMRPLGIRLSIWNCTWQVIQQNWFIGTGTGDSQQALMEKYQENNFTIGYQNDFNAHNMYLQYWMSNGIIALGLFIGLLITLACKAFQNQNSLFFSFVFLFALFSLSESTMRTQKGMVFFVLFAALFYWSPKLWISESDKI